MSVINTMLKDLDKRNKVADDGVFRPKEKKSQTLIIVVVVCTCFIILSIGVVAWLYLSNINQKEQTQLKQNDTVVQSLLKDNGEDEEFNQSLQAQKEKDDEVDLAVLENEIYGPDESEIVDNSKIQKTNSSSMNEKRIEDNSSKQVIVQEEKNKKMSVKQVQLSLKEELELDKKAANIALSQGNIEQAKESYQSMLAKDPKNSFAREKLAALYYGENNLVKARNVLIQGISLDPTHADYRLLLARIYIEQNKNADALATLISLSLKAEQKNADYLATEASLAIELNESSVAIDAYSKLTRIMPKEGKWWFGLGVAFDRQKMKSAAISNYKHAISIGLPEASHKFAVSRLQELER